MADVRCAVCAAKLADGAYVCYSCAGKLERRLRDAAALWDDLATTVVPRLTRLGDPTPRAGRPAPAEPIRPDSGRMRHYADQVAGNPAGLPVDLAASYTAEDVRNTLTTWARVIAEGVHADPPADMDDLTRWVAGRLSWARYEQWAAEMFDELHYAAGLLWQVCDRPIERSYAGPCPTCGMDLYTNPGGVIAACRDCGTECDVAGRQKWMLEQVKDQLARPVEIASVVKRLGVELGYSTVAAYVQNHRVLPKGKDLAGRLLFRIGDVLDVRLKEGKSRRTPSRPRDTANLSGG